MSSLVIGNTCFSFIPGPSIPRYASYHSIPTKTELTPTHDHHSFHRNQKNASTTTHLPKLKPPVRIPRPAPLPTSRRPPLALRCTFPLRRTTTKLNTHLRIPGRRNNSRALPTSSLRDRGRDIGVLVVVVGGAGRGLSMRWGVVGAGDCGVGFLLLAEGERGEGWKGKVAVSCVSQI